MAKPKLALIPATQGSKLYSVLPADGVGDFTFSRNSAATRINKDGLIETVASGVSRLNYPLIDGVVKGCPSHLLEPQRTNLVTYSEDFSNAAWAKSNSSITSNSVISPDGTLNADKLVVSTSAGYLGGTFISSGNTDVTVSFFVKSDTLSNFNFAESFYFGTITNFDLSNGTTDNGKIENYGNGWYRCSKTYTYASGQQIVSIQIKTGITGSLYIFGGQYEQGSYPTSYIPTTTSAVTRVAETANGAGNASTFNDSEGVLMAEINLGSIPTTLKTITLSDGTTSNQIDIRFYTGDWNIFIKDAFYLISYDLLDITASNKLALYYNNGNTKVYINGILLDSKTYNGSFVGLNKLNLSWSDTGSPFYGNTKQIQYFDSALNDSDLETITSWTSFTDMANGQQYSIK